MGRNKMTNVKKLYDSIADVKDDTTRWVLYVQFIMKYFPKCYEAISIRTGEKLR